MIEALIRQRFGAAHLTVVSDDRRLKEAARRRHCPSLGCLDFLEQAGSAAPPQPVAGGAGNRRPFRRGDAALA